MEVEFVALNGTVPTQHLKVVACTVLEAEWDMNPATPGNVREDRKILVFSNVKNSMVTISRSVEFHPTFSGYQSTHQVCECFYIWTKATFFNFVPILKFWIPIFSSQVRGSDRCKLFCRVQDSSTYYLLGASVVDGTQCGADTFDACVAGQCVAAGCDHVLGSGMKLGK